MKLTFLGTCAGTEPMPDRKHASFVLEADGVLYWFDAGEGCSYTAHNLGIDLLKVKKVMISHPHIDHTGGLANLIWNIRKVHYVRQSNADVSVDLYLPDLRIRDGMLTMLRCSDGERFSWESRLHFHPVRDGLLFDDGTVRVSALHNLHIPTPVEQWRSFSFLIESQGKKIVYSGDVRSYYELDGLIGDGCDCLILETGHFGIDDAFAYAKDRNIGKIFFTHNGREILNHPEASRQKIESLFGQKAVICFDGMAEIL